MYLNSEYKNIPGNCNIDELARLETTLDIPGHLESFDMLYESGYAYHIYLTSKPRSNSVRLILGISKEERVTLYHI